MQFITFFYYSSYANQDGIKENIFYFKKAILIFFQVLNFPEEKDKQNYTTYVILMNFGSTSGTKQNFD